MGKEARGGSSKEEDQTRVIDPKVVKRVKALAAKIKPKSYWKQHEPGKWARYIYFSSGPHVGPHMDAVGENIKSRAALVSIEDNRVERESDAYGFTFQDGIVWEETTKDMFDFWWGMADE